MPPASEYHRFAAALFTTALCSAAPAAAQDARTIELNGYDVRVVTAGWELAGRGVPTDVFEGSSTLPAVYGRR